MAYHVYDTLRKSFVLVLFHQYPVQTSGDAWLDSLDSFFGLDNVLVNSLVATINVSFKICQKGQELDERIFNFFREAIAREK